MKTTDIMVELVSEAYEALGNERTVEMRRYMSPELFRHEFATVKLQLPRASGHTETALRLLRNFPGSQMFVPRSNMKNYLRQRESANLHFLNESIHVLPNNHIDTPRTYVKVFAEKNLKAPLVIIDGWGYLTEEGVNQANLLLDMAAPHFDMLVLLQ